MNQTVTATVPSFPFVSICGIGKEVSISPSLGADIRLAGSESTTTCGALTFENSSHMQKSLNRNNMPDLQLKKRSSHSPSFIEHFRDNWPSSCCFRFHVVCLVSRPVVKYTQAALGHSQPQVSLEQN